LRTEFITPPKAISVGAMATISAILTGSDNYSPLTNVSK
jgi:hypothetical protein